MNSYSLSYIAEGQRAGHLEDPIDSDDSEDSDKVTSKGTL